MTGRINTNPSAYPALEERRLHREFYSTMHEVRVHDVQVESGQIQFKFLRGGNPRTAQIPLLGFSIPPRISPDDKNYLRASWGVYFPQVGDVMKVQFDALGRPHVVGYGSIDFPALKRMDDANEDRGGIGWGDASGKRLRPGDWTFKSARGCSLYLGDRAIFSAGPFSVVLDKPNGELKVTGDLVHTWFGTSEKREGSVKRLAIPGVDSTESYITDIVTPGALPGVPAQEHTTYVKRSALPLSILMVRKSEGQVIDDKTKQIAGPLVVSPTSGLAVALVGTATRILRETYDDATGLIPMWTEMVDNLGNWGMGSVFGTGLQWNTPLATWTVTNLTTNWTTSTSSTTNVGAAYTLTVGGLISVTAGAKLDLTAAATLTLKAPSISLAAASISLGASPVALTAADQFSLTSTKGPMTFASGSSMSLNPSSSFSLTAGTTASLSASTSVSLAAPSISLVGGTVNLGATPTDFLMKGTSFVSALGIYLGIVASQMAAIASIPLFAPGSASFAAMGTAAGALAVAVPGTLSAVSKTM